MKNILCDFHNKDLLVSLYFLFVKRLGYNLYIPTGRDWFDEEYWSLIDGGKNGHHSEFAAALCHQFLEHTSNFLDPVQKEINNSVKTITLNEFKDQSIQFDIVLSSVPATLLCFKKLRKFQLTALNTMSIKMNGSMKWIKKQKPSYTIFRLENYFPVN